MTPPASIAGRHLILDVTTRTPRGLDDPALIRSFLDALTRTIGMTAVCPPRIHAVPAQLAAPGASADSQGLSGIVVWLESHASIHTWPEARYFSFDAYSCRDFPHEPVVALLHERFDVATYDALDVARAIGAPQSVRRFHGAVDGRSPSASAI